MNAAFLHIVLGQILLPPINLLLLGLLCCCLPGRLASLRRWGGLFCGLLLLVLALPVTSNLLFGGLESGIAWRVPSPSDTTPPQAIVILGGDNNTGLLQGGIFNGVRAGALSLERTRAGAALHQRTGLPVLVTGGALSADHPPVAKLMADILAGEMSVPVRWQEIQAGTTWENAEFSAALLKQDGISSVYVVTHPWHMRRALIAFRHFGITVWPAPIDLDVLKPQTAADFIPEASAWIDSYYAFHEWIGCAYYALRG